MSAATQPIVRPAVAEPLDIRLMRSLLVHWPLPRGKGILMRCFQPLLRDRDFVFEVVRGVVVKGELQDWMVLYWFMHGATQDPTFEFAWSLLQPGMTVVDVGGNIGLWSLPAAQRVSGSGHVHAFEPFPVNIERFRRNQKLNALANVTVHPYAVSDHAGTAMFYASGGDNSGLGRLAPRESVREYEPVQLVTLDNYLVRNGVAQVDLLKIDVEGAELQVLRGASRLLGGTHAPMLMFELDAELAMAFDATPADIGKLLGGHGYRAYRLQRGRLEAVDLAAHTGHEDLFALRSEHVDASPILRAAIGGRH